MPAPDAGLAPLRRPLSDAAPTASAPLAGARLAAPTTRHPAFTAPLRLSLAASPAGTADVRLDLFQGRWGTAREVTAHGPPLPPRATAALDAAARAGALLYARVALPGDAGRQLVRTLAAVGAARAALPAGKRDAAATRVSAAAARLPPAVAAATSRALDAIDAYVPPSLALASAAALLALVSPPSAAALHAVAAAAPVAASYAATARDHATGRLRAGADLEAAWRRVHRRAALALAPHLTDLPTTPPLAWALDLWDGVATSAGRVAAAAVGDAPALALSVRLPGGRRAEPPADDAKPTRRKRAPSPPPSPRTALLPRSASPPPRHALYGACDHVAQAAPLPPGERVALAVRAAYLAAVFAPFAAAGPLLLLLAALAARAGAHAARARLRAAAWALLLAAVRAAGPAFVKWAQWAGARDDGLAPPDLAATLATLHDAAPAHSWRHTRRCLEAAFGRGAAGRMFTDIQRRPLASGSVAQVHAATLAATGARVAIKVRHPAVADRVRRDLTLLKPLAAAAASLPVLGRGGAGAAADVAASLDQFSATMTAQADLRVEAAHLARFRANFRGVPAVALPSPVAATEAVLVESYERGASVAKYMARRAPFNPQIVAAGVDAYLKMLLSDNFVHTDLHPGNILVRLVGGSGAAADDATLTAAETAADAESVANRMQIVLLDAGLAEELTPAVRTRFVSLITAILRGDGVAGARHMLSFAADQTCPDPAAFQRDMVALFADVADITKPGGIDLDDVLKGCLRAARAHGVRFDSGYAALLVGLVVLVGFGKALDADTNLADAATPAFLAYCATGRALGRLFA